jgi:hypothetical protein
VTTLLGVTGRDDEATSLARVLILSTESRHHQPVPIEFQGYAIESGVVAAPGAAGAVLGGGGGGALAAQSVRGAAHGAHAGDRSQPPA